MDFIFLAFANSEQDPLPTLSKEDDAIYAMLSERINQGHFVVHRESRATTEKIIDQLMLFKDQVMVFHFSGHAGRDQLELEDSSANALGIASFLAQCPKLKLIVLNGCSTAGQVQRLMELDTHPVVIATNAAVGDMTATEFAIRFYQSMVQDYNSVEESFETAFSAAQLISKEDLSPTKGIIVSQLDQSGPVWGIHCKSEFNLEWRLPDFPMEKLTTGYQPNQLLIDELLQGFAENDREAKAIIEDIKSGVARGMLDKREAVLKCLPHPISEQLRKLIVKEQASSGHVFYDRLGHDRLRQITITYNTVIEFFAFILMSQLWDLKMERPQLEIDREVTEAIRQFFSLRRNDRLLFTWLPLIRRLFLTIKGIETSFFIEELEDKKDFLEDRGPFAAACGFMETLKKRMHQLGKATMDQGEAERLCVIAEEKLATIIRELSFLARYTLASVRNIDVIKYRHIKQPRFKHRLVRLVQRFVGLEEEHEVRDGFMDTASVLLLPAQRGAKNFLNLSPFIIDKNAFVEKSNESKLHYFDRYEKGMDAYSFKHIYKPDDLPLVVNREDHFEVVKAQFDAFAVSFFNRPMKEL